MDFCHAKIRRPYDKDYGINKGESNIFGGLWDEKKKTGVREKMAREIHGKESLAEHEFLSYNKEVEVRGLH